MLAYIFHKSRLYSFFSCPGSSLIDLGQSLTDSVSATFEFQHKEWFLRLQTFQTFDQHDFKTKNKKTKRQNDKKTNAEKGKRTKGQKEKKTKRQ